MSAYDYVMVVCAIAGVVFLTIGICHAVGRERYNRAIARGIRALRTALPMRRGEIFERELRRARRDR